MNVAITLHIICRVNTMNVILTLADLSIEYSSPECTISFSEAPCKIFINRLLNMDGDSNNIKGNTNHLWLSL
jgi:hypothetical protein